MGRSGGSSSSSSSCTFGCCQWSYRVGGDESFGEGLNDRIDVHNLRVERPRTWCIVGDILLLWVRAVGAKGQFSLCVRESVTLSLCVYEREARVRESVSRGDARKAKCGHRHNCLTVFIPPVAHAQSHGSSHRQGTLSKCQWIPVESFTLQSSPTPTTHTPTAVDFNCNFVLSASPFLFSRSLFTTAQPLARQIPSPFPPSHADLNCCKSTQVKST